MENNLTKNSMMECPRHGLRRPRFICQHLQYGKGLGFNRPDESLDPDGRLRMLGVINAMSIFKKSVNGTVIPKVFQGLWPYMRVVLRKKNIMKGNK
jgi:hypothetical protein